MTRLTEEMVIARSKQSDLASIKKLNCWGSDLTDVSILKKMKGVEVLALSVNSISSLQNFEDCKQLQELYLRKNHITDINELGHLQHLPALKFVWLEENPFCDKLGSSYRVSVIRLLPNIQKLDNIDVTQEELDEALRPPQPVAVSEPDTYDESYERYQETPSPPTHRHQYSRRSSSPQKEEPMPPPSPKYNSNPKENRVSYQQYEQQRSPGSDQDSPPTGYRERAPIPPSISTHSMKEYYHSDRPSNPMQYRHSQIDLTEWDEHHNNVPAQYSARRSAGPGTVRENGDWEPRRADFYNGFPRRPTHRSSNLLSAALCLIKELDFNSLEVVEHAVRCRINELGTD